MYERILVPVVFDDGHDTQASFKAARLLANEDAQFSVLHVMEAVPAYVTTQIPEEILEESRRELASMLEKSAQALPKASTILGTGKAGRAIVDIAEERGIDCIIMASHKPGLGDLLIGSTADWVVRHAKCSVHVIR